MNWEEALELLLYCQHVKTHEDRIHHITGMYDGFPSETPLQSPTYSLLIRISPLSRLFSVPSLSLSTLPAEKQKQTHLFGVLKYSVPSELQFATQPQSLTQRNAVLNETAELFDKHEYLEVTARHSKSRFDFTMDATYRPVCLAEKKWFPILLFFSGVKGRVYAHLCDS